jgi:hypothetical protein
VYLRFEHMRGHLDDDALASEFMLVRSALESSGEAHLQEFLGAWKT